MKYDKYSDKKHGSTVSSYNIHTCSFIALYAIAAKSVDTIPLTYPSRITSNPWLPIMLPPYTAAKQINVIRSHSLQIIVLNKINRQPLAIGHLGRAPPCEYITVRELIIPCDTLGLRNVSSGACVRWMSHRDKSL